MYPNRTSFDRDAIEIFEGRIRGLQRRIEALPKHSASLRHSLNQELKAVERDLELVRQDAIGLTKEQEK